MEMRWVWCGVQSSPGFLHCQLPLVVGHCYCELGWMSSLSLSRLCGRTVLHGSWQHHHSEETPSNLLFPLVLRSHLWCHHTLLRRVHCMRRQDDCDATSPSQPVGSSELACPSPSPMWYMHPRCMQTGRERPCLSWPRRRTCASLLGNTWQSVVPLGWDPCGPPGPSPASHPCVTSPLTRIGSPLQDTARSRSVEQGLVESSVVLVKTKMHFVK